MVLSPCRKRTAIKAQEDFGQSLPSEDSSITTNQSARSQPYESVNSFHLPKARLLGEQDKVDEEL